MSTFTLCSLFYNVRSTDVILKLKESNREGDILFPMIDSYLPFVMELPNRSLQWLSIGADAAFLAGNFSLGMEYVIHYRQRDKHVMYPSDLLYIGAISQT